MGATPVYGLPYPELDEPPNGPALGQNLADAVETEIARIDAIHAAENSAWTAYTPTWTAVTTNPSIGNGTLVGAYTTRGKLGIASIEIVYNTTTNVGSGVYSFGLPSGWSVVSFNRNYGSALMRDQSAAIHSVGVPTHATTTTLDVRAHGINQVAHNSPFTWATGDFIRILFIGELA